MIGIQLDGDSEFLETLPDTSISIKIENPILGSSERLSPGSYSMPFNLPGGNVSPKNSAKLNNPDVLENNEAYQIQKAKLFLNGIPFKNGNLKSNSFDTKNIVSHFTFGLNSINADFKTAKLRDALDEDVVISNSAIGRKIYIKKLNGEGNPATIEVNGVSFTDDSMSGIIVLINDYFDTSTGSVTDTGVWVPVGSVPGSGNTPLGVAPPYGLLQLSTAITDPITGLPFFSLGTDPHLPLSVKVPEDQLNNWYVEGFDMTSYYSDFQTFITNSLLDNKLRFPVRFNENLHSGETVKEYKIINGVTASGVVTNNANWGAQNDEPTAIKNYNSIQPFLMMKWVLDKIADRFDFEWEGDFYEEPGLATMLIDNSQTLDLLQDFLGDTKFIFWRRSFNLNELVPDISVVDFLKALQSRYNLAVYFNEETKKVRLKKREVIAVSNVYEDITDLCSPVENIQDERVTGFTLKVLKEDSDLFSTEEKITVGTSERDIEIRCGRLHAMDGQLMAVGSGLVRGPYVSQKNTAKFNLRVFHYIGLVNNGAFTYQAADITSPVLDEQLNLGYLSLYGKFHKYWLFFEKNRLVVKLKINLPLRRLLRFDFEIKRRFNRNNFLVKSLDVRITNRGVQITGAELLTMR